MTAPSRPRRRARRRGRTTKRGRARSSSSSRCRSSLLFGLLGPRHRRRQLLERSLHVQHAAEAGALAGVPYMPGDFTTAIDPGHGRGDEEQFTTGTGSTRDGDDRTGVRPPPRRDHLQQFNTFFLRCPRHAQVTITRTATAEYTLPVPMGSPLDCFGDNSGGFWAVVAAQGSDRGNGDAFGSYYNPNPTVNTATTRRLRLRDRRPRRRRLHEHRPVRPDVLRGRPDEGHRRPLARELDGWPAFSTYYTLWSRPGRDAARLHRRRPRRSSSGTLFEHKRQVDRSAALPRHLALLPGEPASSRCPTARSDDVPQPLVDADHRDDARRPTGSTSRPRTPSNTTTRRASAARTSGACAPSAPDPTYKAHVYGLGQDGDLRQRQRRDHRSSTSPGSRPSMPARRWSSSSSTPATHPATRASRSSNRRRPGTRRRRSATPPTRTPLGSELGTNVTSLATTISGTAQYNNAWVTLTVPLPKTYTAPLPPGEPAGTLGGWWKIKYNFTARRPTLRPGRCRSGATPSTSSSRDEHGRAAGGSPARSRVLVLPVSGGSAHHPGQSRQERGAPCVPNEAITTWRWSTRTQPPRTVHRDPRLVLALLAGGAAYYMINQAQTQAGQGGLQTVTIVVALKEIPARKPIEKADVGTRDVPIDETNAQGVFADPPRSSASCRVSGSSWATRLREPARDRLPGRDARDPQSRREVSADERGLAGRVHDGARRPGRRRPPPGR